MGWGWVAGDTSTRSCNAEGDRCAGKKPNAGQEKEKEPEKKNKNKITGLTMEENKRKEGGGGDGQRFNFAPLTS